MGRGEAEDVSTTRASEEKRLKGRTSPKYERGVDGTVVTVLPCAPPSVSGLSSGPPWPGWPGILGVDAGEALRDAGLGRCVSTAAIGSEYLGQRGQEAVST